MKKLTWLVLTLVLVGSMVVSVGCSSTKVTSSTTSDTAQATVTTQTAVSDTTSAAGAGAATVVTSAQETTAAVTAKTTFTLDELKAYDGQNGNSAYVAIDGIIFDVTNNKEWKNGQHQGLSAGNDLTADLASSPHGTSALGNLTQVGTLVS